LKRFIHRNWFPLALAAALALIGSLPYLYGYAIETPDSRFMGFVGRGVFGHNGYLMLARQAQSGLHLMENLLAPEPLPRVFFNLEWWLFGKTARWTGLSLVGTFHVYRVATTIIFALSVMYLLRQCLVGEFKQRFALAIIMLGSGFGWAVLAASRVATAVSPAARQLAQDMSYTGVTFKNVLFPMPPDVAGISVPAYLVAQPHFILAAAFASLTAAFLIQAATSRQTRYYVLAGFAALAHMFIRPYSIPEIYLLFALFPALMAWRDRRIGARTFAGPATAAAIPAPMVVYYGWLAYVGALGGTGPAWRPWSFVMHIGWLGLPYVLALAALPSLTRFRKASPALLFMGLWLVLAFLIEQASLWYHGGQEAAWAAYIIAPTILAAGGPFSWAYSRLSPRWRTPAFKRTAAILIVVLSMPSFAVAYGRMFTDLQNHPAPYYVSTDLYSALEWLERNADKHDTVLASFETGQLVPRIAGVKTFQGHYMINPNAAEKRDLADRFYAKPNDDAFKRNLVQKYGIRYVILGPLERHPGGFQPTQHQWLEPVFTQNKVQIFKVEIQ